MKEDLEKSKNAGFMKHLVKPIEFVALKKVLFELYNM